MARTLVHPGPVSKERIVSREGNLVITKIQLKKGMPLIDAVSEILEEKGIRGAGIKFKNLKLAPVNYVMPTYSKDDKHVAFYSETHTLEEGIVIDYANATYGIRENVPFMHFHGLWKRDDKQNGGHILAPISIVAEDCEAIAYSASGVEVDSVFDEETNFTIFRPVKGEGKEISGRKCIVATVKANEDLLTAIKTICNKHNIFNASIWSGIGSTVGGIFENGNVVEEIPTELIVTNGEITKKSDGYDVEFETALIDANGIIHFGKLKKDENPVLILFELVIVEK